MRVPYQQTRPGCYRLAQGVHLRGEALICDYPLRALRPGPIVLKLLAYCSQDRSSTELAALLRLPVKRVESLCEQLYWKGLLDAGARKKPETWPGISIIIPSYNRAQQLERCLASLLDLDYPPSCMEIVVVDDASSDNTCAMLEQFSGECEAKGISLRVVRHARRRGVAVSRNSGAGQARMELLAFIDSDCVASPGWLQELAPAFEDQRIGAVGGMVRAYERRSALGRYEDVRSSLFTGVRPQQVRLAGPLTYLPTANLLVRRSEWQNLGGFAPLTYGEDVDFCHRLLLSGSAMRYEPRGIVLHDYRTSLAGFVKTRITYASAEAALLNRYPAERRLLLLPPEQATFAGLVTGGLWRLIRYKGHQVKRGRPLEFSPPTAIINNRISASNRRRGRPQGSPPCILFVAALLLALVGAFRRLVAVRRQHISLNPLIVFRATLRGHLAYIYHLCRHLTRYYTLPVMLASIVFPPLLLLAFILCSIVIGVDYARLRPHMTVGAFALCSLLDDCTYEIGVLFGCIKHRTWKPLIPVIKTPATKM